MWESWVIAYQWSADYSAELYVLVSSAHKTTRRDMTKNPNK